MEIKKSFTSFLILMFFVSTFYLALPNNRAQAVVPQIVSDPPLLIQQIIAVAKSIASLAVQVQNQVNTWLSAYYDMLNYIKEYIGDTGAWIISKMLINDITSSFINFVNIGDDGNPLYITNLQNYIDGFTYDTADNLIETVTADLGLEGMSGIYSSLDRDYRQYHSLSSKLSTKFAGGEEFLDGEGDESEASSGCEVVADLSGWDKIEFLSSYPQCTPQGAYMIATDHISEEIRKKEKSEEQQLLWGSGIRPKTDKGADTEADEECDPEFGPCQPKEKADCDPEFGPCQPPKKKADSEINIITPAASIKDQLSGFLSTGRATLEGVDEIGELVATLITNLTSMISGAKGLLGIDSNAIDEYDMENDREDYSDLSDPVPPEADSDTAQTNLAPLRKDYTESSSQFADFSAENASDGTTIGSAGDNSGSVAQTLVESHPWWQIDLGKEEPIDYIKIFRRTSDTDANKAIGQIDIYLSNTPFGNTRGQMPSVEPFESITMPSTGPATVEINSTGRYLRIQRSESGETRLQLAEVQIFNNPPPIITLIGSNKISQKLGDGDFEDPGATAQDEKDGDITDNIEVDGEVDAETKGSYTLTYYVEDSGGASSKKTRTVVIKK